MWTTREPCSLLLKEMFRRPRSFVSSGSTHINAIARTDADFKSYIKTVWLPKALEPELAPLWASYPDDSTKGSPFDTGSANQIYGQYKRVAAFQGDSAFQSPRRYFQQQLSGKTKMWTYCKRHRSTVRIISLIHLSPTVSKKLKTASAFGSVSNIQSFGEPTTQC